jgi:hypothetical protein
MCNVTDDSNPHTLDLHYERWDNMINFAVINKNNNIRFKKKGEANRQPISPVKEDLFSYLVPIGFFLK